MVCLCRSLAVCSVGVAWTCLSRLCPMTNGCAGVVPWSRCRCCEHDHVCGAHAEAKCPSRTYGCAWPRERHRCRAHDCMWWCVNVRGRAKSGCACPSLRMWCRCVAPGGMCARHRCRAHDCVWWCANARGRATSGSACPSPRMGCRCVAPGGECVWHRVVCLCWVVHDCLCALGGSKQIAAWRHVYVCCRTRTRGHGGVDDGRGCVLAMSAVVVPIKDVTANNSDFRGWFVG